MLCSWDSALNLAKRLSFPHTLFRTGTGYKEDFSFHPGNATKSRKFLSQPHPLLHCCYCCSVPKSCPILCDPWLQHARLPCPSLSPRVCSNLCPLTWWCCLTIFSLSSCPQSFPAQGSLPGESALCSRLWSGISPAVSVNKDVTAFSNFQPPNVNEGSQKGKQYLWSSRGWPPPHGAWCWVGRGECERLKKNRILAPDSWDAYERNDFNNPRLLHLPIHRRTLNSLTWCLVFLINNNLWCSYCLPFVANLCIGWLSLPSPRSGLSGLPEMLSPRLEVLRFSHWIKHSLPSACD